MSVVNDVLKNLNQRQAIQGGATPYYFQDKPSNGKWIWLCLVLCFVLIFSLIGFILVNMGSSNQQIHASSLTLPDDVFVYEGVMDKSVDGRTHSVEVVSVTDLTVTDPTVTAMMHNTAKLNDPNTIKNLKQATIENQIPLVKDKTVELKTLIASAISTDVDKTKAATSVKVNKQKIVKKTDISAASESVVAAINSGDMAGAKNKLNQASRRVQDEVQYRVLLKENPQMLLSQIKRQYPDYQTQPRMLALAAQGQQRAGYHESAANLYTRLIPMEPQAARWRVGLAISLDALGDIKSAKRLYELALSMGTLPYSLKRFSENRLERIKP